MVYVVLGLGSNSNPGDNISSCLDALLLQFHDMKLSSVFESVAEGSAAKGSNPDTYLNMAVGFDCSMPLEELIVWLKKLETRHGRKPAGEQGNDQAVNKVPLDIDILLYGSHTGSCAGVTLPRPQILASAYVLWPLSQVAAQQRHPERNETYAALWKNFSGNRSGIRPVNFEWHGRRLSCTE